MNLSMDLNLLRSLLTLVGLLAFIALVIWAWGRGRRQAFDEAARLPLIDGDAEAGHNVRSEAAVGQPSRQERNRS